MFFYKVVNLDHIWDTKNVMVLWKVKKKEKNRFLMYNISGKSIDIDGNKILYLLSRKKSIDIDKNITDAKKI